MNDFLTAEEAAKKSQEYVDTTVYEVRAETEAILMEAISEAIEKNAREVALTVGWYGIEEGSNLVTKFLESKGYKEVSVVEKWYTCFDNSRGYTEIQFKF